MEKVKNLGFIGHPNYEVTSNGEVFSLNFRNSGKRRQLRATKTKKGYLHVSLKDGKYEYIHRLVALAFIPNPNNLPQINHRDENKSNNNVDNLEWCDGKYNRNYGTTNKRLSKINTNGVLSKPVLQYDKNGNLLKKWPSIIEVKRQLGIHAGAISLCCRGSSKYSHAGGFCWEYKK